MSEPLEKVVFVTVSGGVAYICEDTVPPGIRVEILDFDNLAESPADYARLSAGAQAYLSEHFG